MRLLVLATTLVSVPGERLEYEIRYGPVVLGSLELRELAPETLASVECRHLQASLVLDSPFTWLFWAHYEFESWASRESLITLRSNKRTRETNYRANWTADFDRSAGVVRYSDGSTYSVPASCRDLLTLWYWFRTYTPGQTREVRADAHVDRKNYRLRATVASQRGVRTRAGVFDCIVMVPEISGPLGTVYLADRSDRIPVVIRTTVAGLTVSAMLKAVYYEGK
ncbi:MAG: DUF3108 domain-containing protein [candidate division WOR-3 bacterium]